MITFKNVNKEFSSKPILHDINLKIHKGESFCLLGKSGSGKTTLLKLINKLILPKNGIIKVMDNDIAEMNNKGLRENIGYIIQSGGLFPHLKISDNIALPLKLAKVSKSTIKKRVIELIQQIGLDESYLTRYPSSLSGGQQQRIGIARAIANYPKILLMDEPFSALDPILREQMQNDFLQMESLQDITKVIVTHDLNEALKLGHRICLLDEGRIQFVGTPEEFLYSPIVAVKNYLGEESNLLQIKQIQLKDLLPLKEVNQNQFTNILDVTGETPVFQIISKSHQFIRFIEQNKYFETSQIKNALVKQIDNILNGSN